MTTSIDVANRALLLLGAREITSFTENSNEAKIAKALYLSTRDFVLRAYPWASLKKRAKLSKLAEKPVNGYQHQYQLPEDSIRVIEVWCGDHIADEKWEVNGERILTDAHPVSIVYLSNKIPENDYSPQLVSALVYRLASEMAYPVTGNGGAQGNFSALFSQALDEARTTDALERSSQQIGPRRFTRVRL